MPRSCVMLPEGKILNLLNIVFEPKSAANAWDNVLLVMFVKEFSPKMLQLYII